RTSEQPAPQGKICPVDQFTSVALYEQALVYLGLCNAFHARPQSVAHRLQRRLDAEEVTPFLLFRYRGDPLDPIGHRLFGNRRDAQHAGLADFDIFDVTFVDLEDHPIRVEWGDPEQLLSALDRRANRLAEVAEHDDAIERRHQGSA